MISVFHIIISGNSIQILIRRESKIVLQGWVIWANITWDLIAPLISIQNLIVYWSQKKIRHKKITTFMTIWLEESILKIIQKKNGLKNIRKAILDNLFLKTLLLLWNIAILYKAFQTWRRLLYQISAFKLISSFLKVYIMMNFKSCAMFLPIYN